MGVITLPDAGDIMKRREIWMVVLPLLLFGLLALTVKAGLSAGLEDWFYSEAVEDMSPLWTAIVKAVTHTGDTPAVVLICLLLFVLPRSRRTIALPVSAAVILSTVLNLLLKELFARQRPDILRLINETSYSFPSGHAMINGTLYFMLLFLTFRFVGNRGRRNLLAGGCLFMLIAIGYSRVYLGVHYAGDILGGWLLGFAVTTGVYLRWERGQQRKAYRSKNEGRSND